MTRPVAPEVPETGEMTWIRVTEPSTCAAVRRRAAEAAREIGLEPHRVDEVSVVASELASNLVKHARDGSVLLRRLRTGDRRGVGVLTVDSGPGTRDLAALAEDGRTTTGTLGIGLGAVKRFADRLDLHSLPGVGTIVSAEFWAAAAGTGDEPTDLAAITRPFPGETVCGDAYAHRTVPGARLVMLADGLGHGAMAARASEAAVRTFLTSTEVTPGRLLEAMHQSLRETRGAAVAVARTEAESGRVTYAGVGNISGRIVDTGSSSHLSSQPGIVGSNMPTVRELPFTIAPGQSLVMHSDGLTERWDLAELPGILGAVPVVMSVALLRTAGTRRDDASVLVMRSRGQRR
jgi:anti-sigma regulatory factor (Ser/Thr protein kinase)